MTENANLKQLTFGGVRFNPSDIKEKKVITNSDGAVRYSVFLKNGVNLEYPEQKVTNEANVGIFETKIEQQKRERGQYNYDTTTRINGMAYGKITKVDSNGKSEKDHITISGGKNNTIDVSQGDYEDHDLVEIKDRTVKSKLKDKTKLKQKAQNNTVIKDTSDKVKTPKKGNDNTKIDVKY